MGYELVVPETWLHGIWTFLACLGVSWILIFVGRFLYAPYQFWGRAEEKSGELAARLVSKIDIALPQDGNGVREIPAEGIDANGQIQRIKSKFVSFDVACATDVPLEDCETRLVSVERLSDGNQLVDDPVHCEWGNKQSDEKAITIRPKVTERVNLFALYEGRSGIEPRLNPLNFRLRDGIQTPGLYRVMVVVTAKDAPSLDRSFLFDWTNFENITLRADDGISNIP